MISNNLLKRIRKLYSMIFQSKKGKNSKRKKNKDWNKLNRKNKENMKIKKRKKYCSREEFNNSDSIQKLNSKSISIVFTKWIIKILRKLILFKIWWWWMKLKGFDRICFLKNNLTIWKRNLLIWERLIAQFSKVKIYKLMQ